MKRFLIPVLGSALTLAATGPARAGDDAVRSPHDRLADAVEASEAGDCAKATILAAPLMRGGPSIPGADQAGAYDVAITCAIRAKDWAAAGDAARRATALPDGSDFAWRVLVIADTIAKRYGAALDTLERMALGHGRALNSIRPVWLWQMRTEIVRAHDEANETRLLRIMADPAYDPDDLAGKVTSSGDQARVLYARKLLAAGRRDEARAQLAGLQGFDALSEVALDPALLALHGGSIDLRAAVDGDLVRHRALVEQYPRWLGAINAVALDLKRLGRDDETIALLKAALPRIESADAFDDRDDALPWFWNAFAYAYEAIGDYDNMVAYFAKGAATPENGVPNVSQAINLAAKQVGFGRAKEALATLAAMGDKPEASPFGLMQIRIVRGCAYAVLGQLDQARAEVAYAVAHPDDDPAAIAALKLCAGDEAGAAASYIARLGNADTRRTAMLDLADYDARDRRAPVGPFDAAFDRMRKRPDVVAAIRSVGGPLRIHLQRDPF